MEAIIVGAGGSGVLHALALRAAGVRIGAVYDPDSERARALADAFGARVVPTFASAVAVPAELAAICSPPNLHVAQAEALADGARTVFVEKPVATRRPDLLRLATLPGCVPILQWRAGRALRALRRAMLHGDLGPAPFVSCDLAWARDDAYLQERRGWGCGAVLAIGIHALDAISWATGCAIEGAAGIIAGTRGATTETAAVAALRLAGGGAIAFRVSFDGGADATRITICGGGMTGHLAGSEGDPTSGSWDWAGPETKRQRLIALEHDTPGAVGAPLLVPYLGAAVAALRDGERPGDSERLPAIADVFGAHAAAMYVAQSQ